LLPERLAPSFLGRLASANASQFAMLQQC